MARRYSRSDQVTLVIGSVVLGFAIFVLLLLWGVWDAVGVI